MENKRLDVLIYAHDGRGLGHVSRSVAVGMAYRRLYPERRVLFVSGSRFTGELIGEAPLDWIKLPAYETTVVAGVSRGVPGKSNFADAELGELREEMIASLVSLYRPRCILADHLPQGKHRELRQALEKSRNETTMWILGVRGIVGNVPNAGAGLARQLFRDHYRSILWYGDSRVLGDHHLRELAATYGVEPYGTGYVSRLKEFQHLQPEAVKPEALLAGTVSLPWMTPSSEKVLHLLTAALERLGAEAGKWHIYTDAAPDIWKRMVHDVSHLSFCRLMRTGGGYFKSLLRSKTALVYGGYNSLTDVLTAGIPAVVLLRGMRDGEQEEHVRRLLQHCPNRFVPLEETGVAATALQSGLELTRQSVPEICPVCLDGAENAARFVEDAVVQVE